MVLSCRRPRPGGWSSLALVLLQLAVLLRAYRYPEGRSCLLLRLSNGAGARPPPLMRRARRPLSPPLFPLGPSSGSWPAADRARAMRAAESSEAERQAGSADGSQEGTVRTCRVCHQTFISELNHDRACRYVGTGGSLHVARHSLGATGVTCGLVWLPYGPWQVPPG